MGTVGLPMLLACGGLSRLPCDLVAPGVWTWKLSGARSWFPAGPLHPGIGGEMGIPRQVGGGSPLAPSEGKATEQARHEPASTLLGQGQGRRTSAPAVGVPWWCREALRPLLAGECVGLCLRCCCAAETGG